MTPEEHYKALSDRHHRESLFYQAQLFHSWRVIQGQNKGLRRLNRKVKRLRAELETALKPSPPEWEAVSEGLRQMRIRKDEG